MVNVKKMCVMDTGAGDVRRFLFVLCSHSFVWKGFYKTWFGFRFRFPGCECIGLFATTLVGKVPTRLG